MLLLIKKIKKHVIFKTVIFLFIQWVFCVNSYAVFINENHICFQADNISPRVNLQTADFTYILNRYYFLKETGLVPEENHGFQEAEKEIDFYDLSAKFSKANSEKEAILLLKDAVMALGFKGMTVNIVRQTKDKKAVLYRNVFREGMKGNELSIEWRKLLPADEKRVNILTSTLKKPYMHIKNRNKSPYVYAPWLLKDVFLYRFGAASIIKKTITKLIDYFCIFNNKPAYWGLKLVESFYPLWLKRVNESLNITILDRYGNALGQILINNWIDGKPLFADAEDKKERLKKLTAITHQASFALQYIKYKNKLSDAKIPISNTIDGLKQLEKIVQIYEQNNRVIHSSKNRLCTMIPGMIYRIRKKSSEQNKLRAGILPFAESIIKTAETLEETHLLENFEGRDTEDRLQELQNILKFPDRLISANGDSKQKQPFLLSGQSKNIDAVSIWSVLSRRLLQASTIKEIESLHAQARELFKDNPYLLTKETNLYNLARLCLESEEQYKIQQILEDNITVIQTFLSEYKPLLFKVIKLVNEIKLIYESYKSHVAPKMKELFNAVFKEKEELDELNKEYFDLIELSRTCIHKLDIKTYNISNLAREYIEKHIDILAEQIGKTHGVKYSFKYEITENLYGKTDKIEFKLIMENLLLNAIKYSPKGGLITLRVEKDQDMVIVSITDEGMGIDPAKLGKIGGKYERLGMENTNIKGSGLGLSYVKEILEQMHGEMRVFSKGKGKGSNFTVYLPAALKKEQMLERPVIEKKDSYPRGNLMDINVKGGFKSRKNSIPRGKDLRHAVQPLSRQYAIEMSI